MLKKLVFVDLPCEAAHERDIQRDEVEKVIEIREYLDPSSNSGYSSYEARHNTDLLDGAGRQLIWADPLHPSS
jgi:hypothetical protein